MTCYNSVTPCRAPRWTGSGRVVGPHGRLGPLQAPPPTSPRSSATSQCTGSYAPLRALPRAVRAASARHQPPPPLRETTLHFSPPVPHLDCSRGRWTASGRKLLGRQPEVAGAPAGYGTTLPVRLRGAERLLCAGARPACVTTSPVLERCCGSARAPC